LEARLHVEADAVNAAQFPNLEIVKTVPQLAHLLAKPKLPPRQRPRKKRCPLCGLPFAVRRRGPIPETCSRRCASDVVIYRPAMPERLAKKLADPTPRQRLARHTVAEAPPGRIVGYVRVSTDEQAEAGQSLSVQQRQLIGWAMQRGRQLDQVMIEAGVSSGMPFSERPQGSKLGAGLRRGDTLVAAKLDRCFRSAADCLTVVEAFKVRGICLLPARSERRGG
jgi:hypothetical protein